ncbi:putative metalloprotease CJM1_0395 family protein [Chitinilyticum litopenaei]|uniref:putative metalloprotease CJM1_0395 family protein n=1 Tax=Chitinilyticum litopenaei TaxID=1121276 RepID=UPI0004245D24|nr:putative metalloprotease CJM1_0395 family protein [Chitinilyticum litopenaei]
MFPSVGSMAALISSLPDSTRPQPRGERRARETADDARTDETRAPARQKADGKAADEQEEDKAIPPGTPRSPSGQPLSPQQIAQIQELEATDRKVRQHEQAHLAAAGGLAVSGANYTMVTGPDGKRYAVAGDVRIDVSPGRTPEETVRKARMIQAAALAPADPSATDRSVAAEAARMEQQALQEMRQRSSTSEKLSRSYDSNELPQGVFSAYA